MKTSNLDIDDASRTLKYWYESRIQGRSSSMCINAEYVKADLLVIFDEVEKMIRGGEDYQPSGWMTKHKDGTV